MYRTSKDRLKRFRLWLCSGCCAIGAGIGASSGVAFGAMIEGDIVAGADVGVVIGGLSGGGRSVCRTAQSNDQIYSQCMTQKGYKILQTD